MGACDAATSSLILQRVVIYSEKWGWTISGLRLRELPISAIDIVEVGFQVRLRMITWIG